MNQAIALGTDIEEISRFEGKDISKDRAFLDRIFTPEELEYCYSNKQAAPHLCARYCAKESVVKALTDFGITDVYYSDIEVLRNQNGVPQVKLDKYPDLRFKLSISHSKNYATAVVLAFKN